MVPRTARPLALARLPPGVQLVFDLDGVLLDSDSDLSWLDRALVETLEAFDLPVTDGHKAKLYPATPDSFRAAADELGVDPDALWRVRHGNYVDVKNTAIREGELESFDDVAALYDLRGDHALSIVSNSPQSVVDAFVESCGYDDLFVAGVGRGDALEDLTRMKPRPHLYRRLRERIDAEGDWYVGDAVTDREFAECVGMSFVPVDRGGGDGIADLAEVAVRIA